MQYPWGADHYRGHPLWVAWHEELICLSHHDNETEISIVRNVEGALTLRVAVMSLVICLASCGGQTEHIAPDIRLADGRQLSDLATDGSPMAVLVFDPSECVTCGRTLREWTRLHQEQPASVAIILSRQPNVVERRLLLSIRLKPNGVLESASGEGEVFRGIALLFVDRRVVVEEQPDFGATAPYPPILRSFAAEKRGR